MGTSKEKKFYLCSDKCFEELVRQQQGIKEGIRDAGDEEDAPRGAIAACLGSIREDLQGLKARFPQIAGIESAELEVPGAGAGSPGKNGAGLPGRGQPSRFRLDYRQGFVRDDRLRGPTFEKDGCSLMVEVR
jgi:hypothetical protein